MKFNPVLAVCTVLLSAVTAWLFYMGSESWVYAVGEGVLALAFLSVGLGGVSLKEYPRSSVFCVIASYTDVILKYTLLVGFGTRSGLGVRVRIGWIVLSVVCSCLCHLVDSLDSMPLFDC